MEVVILAGGLGTRLSEETHLKPKPMVEIGNKPIVWHIMKKYENFGFNDFILALGYKGDIIKDYFLNSIQVEGWTSIIIIVTLLGGIQLLTLGILGEYLWRTSNDSKRRPLYLLDCSSLKSHSRRRGPRVKTRALCTRRIEYV